LVSAVAALDALLGLVLPALSHQVSLVAATLAVLALVAERRL
jgi:hypothetical protein